MMGFGQGQNNTGLVTPLAFCRYPGIRAPRVRGAEYDQFVDEFMSALQGWQPHLLVQVREKAVSVLDSLAP